RATSSAETVEPLMVAPYHPRQYDQRATDTDLRTLATGDWPLKMSRVVMKFGGTSVADLARIRNVATRVKREVDAGHEVAVVVSAMAGTTNQLVDWVRGIAVLHHAREYDG